MNADCKQTVRRCLAVAMPLLFASAAGGHPLGNDNVEHFSVLWIMRDRLEVDLLLFIAETQSRIVQRDEIDTDKDEQDTAEEQKAWLNKRAKEFERSLRATIDGEAFALRAVEEAVDPATGRKATASRIIMKMPGYAGMPTYRLLIRYVGRYPKPLTPGRHTLDYEDATFARNPGIKRIILERIPDVEVFEPHPEFWGPDTDPFRFEQYDPADLPQERKATVTFRIAPPVIESRPAALASAPTANGLVPPATAPAETPPLEIAASAPATAPAQVPPSGIAQSAPATMPAYIAATEEPPAAPPPSATDEAEAVPGRYGSAFAPENRPRNKYREQADRLLARLRGDWGLMVLLSVTAISFVWGAAHALMPGHAKTVVAAYLISQRGTYWHAVLLAIVVTMTHTALVVIVGLVLAFCQAGSGERLQLWLGLVSGLIIAGLGLVLVWRASTGRPGHHHHEHDHHHADEKRSWLRRLFTHSHPHVPAHSHPHSHPHAHPHPHHGDHRADGHQHAHDHAHPHTHNRESGRKSGASAGPPLTTRLVLALGISGGIVPCPTAAFIMLIGAGGQMLLAALYAVLVFSLGLALTLMVVGFLALSSRRFAAKLLSDAGHEGELSGRGQWLMLRAVPTISGCAVIFLGSLIAASYVHHMFKGTALVPWLG